MSSLAPAMEQSSSTRVSAGKPRARERSVSRPPSFARCSEGSARSRAPANRASRRSNICTPLQSGGHTNVTAASPQEILTMPFRRVRIHLTSNSEEQGRWGGERDFRLGSARRSRVLSQSRALRKRTFKGTGPASGRCRSPKTIHRLIERIGPDKGPGLPERQPPSALAWSHTRGRPAIELTPERRGDHLPRRNRCAREIEPWIQVHLHLA